MDCPFSAGQAAARVHLPAGACDAHIHVYDRRCPTVPGARLRPPDASLAQYRQVQARMGTQRAVVVTPSTYGCNNTLLLQALTELGEHGRGVAVIDAQTPDAELAQLHEHGVRGVRLNLSLGVSHRPSDIRPIAERIAPLGWHLQLLMPPDTLLAQAPLLQALVRELPLDLVLDHFARLGPQHLGQHPAHADAHAQVLALLATGRVWLKLSGGYLVSPQGSSEDPALHALARSFIDAAPERMLWGSDWPHASASAGLHPWPDDARQIECLAQWAGDAHTLQQLLVHNPQQLYGFTPWQ